MKAWQRPAAAGADGPAIEVRESATGYVDPDRILVRRSAGRRHLACTRAEFAVFIAAAKAGEYDHLLAAGDCPARQIRHGLDHIRRAYGPRP